MAGRAWGSSTGKACLVACPVISWLETTSFCWQYSALPCLIRGEESQNSEGLNDLLLDSLPTGEAGGGVQAASSSYPDLALIPGPFAICREVS